MRCEGEWLPCDDGIVRPIVRAKVLGGDDEWKIVIFLVDTGADRTVISASVLDELGLPFVQPQDRIGGVGGLVNSVDVTTRIRLPRDDGQWITLRGAVRCLFAARRVGHERAWPRHFEHFCGNCRPTGGSGDFAPWCRQLRDKAPAVKRSPATTGRLGIDGLGSPSYMTILHKLMMREP